MWKMYGRSQECKRRNMFVGDAEEMMVARVGAEKTERVGRSMSYFFAEESIGLSNTAIILYERKTKTKMKHLINLANSQTSSSF